MQQQWDWREGDEGVFGERKKLWISHHSNHRCFFNTLLCWRWWGNEGGGLFSPHSFRFFFPPGLSHISLRLRQSQFDLHFGTYGAAPSFQHACRPAHKGHFLNIFCSSYYEIHQKLKRQSRKAAGERRTPKAGITMQIHDWGWKSGLFYHIHRETHFHIWWEIARLPCL